MELVVIEVLEFYAEREHYNAVCGMALSDIGQDKGRRARAALRKVRKMRTEVRAPSEDGA